MKGLADPDEFARYVAWVKGVCVERFGEVGEVLPHAQIIATQHPDTGEPFPDGAMAIPMGATRLASSEDYTGFLKAIRAAALKMKAVGVIFIAERWMASIPLGEAAPCLNETDLGGARREAIGVTIDHLSFERTATWVAFITRTSSGAPRLHPWRRLPDDARVSHSERFSDMFPRELWQ